MTRASVGEYLAQQRKLRGISVNELCELTKIPRRNLERLESGAFDQNPDGFARGFVRSVADALGLDPDEAVMRLMQEPEEDVVAEGQALGGLAIRAVGLVLVLGVVALAWSFGARWLASVPEARSEPERPDVTYRKDAVGELAREKEFVFPRDERPAE